MISLLPRLIVPFLALCTAIPLAHLKAADHASTSTGLPEGIDTKLHLYLLIGQSNMAGRGVPDAESTQADPRVLMLTKDLKWIPATDPMHFDKPEAGVGPGIAFGKTMAAAEPDVRVGLVPCAVGGSPISAWKLGAYYAPTKSHPYDDMLVRIREAQKVGVLKGILWHQGESDRSNCADYGEKLTALIVLLRKDLNSPNVPFVVGELASFDQKNAKDTAQFNAVINGLGTSVTNYACVSSAGMKDKGDHLHFDAASARVIGKRYAEKMLQLEKQLLTPSSQSIIDQ